MAYVAITWNEDIVLCLLWMIVQRSVVLIVSVCHDLEFGKLQYKMDWQGLQLLLKAPKKKYIKKLIQYAVILNRSPTSVPNLLNTPISQEFHNDMELTTQQSHKLLNALIQLVGAMRAVAFNEQAMANVLSPHISSELSEIIVDIFSKMSDDLQENDNNYVEQAEKLMLFQWALEMEVASDKGKTNIPVVKLDLKSSKNCQIKSTILEMKGTQFSVFFKNLQKMKEQLGQLVSGSE